jgi:hypothetical protein
MFAFDVNARIGHAGAELMLVDEMPGLEVDCDRTGRCKAATNSCLLRGEEES